MVLRPPERREFGILGLCQGLEGGKGREEEEVVVVVWLVVCRLRWGLLHYFPREMYCVVVWC